MKLLENYWIILVLFCILGLFFNKEGKIPGNIFYFLDSEFAVHQELLSVMVFVITIVVATIFNRADTFIIKKITKRG